MRTRKAIVALAALAACQRAPDSPAPAPQRSPKLVRAAEPIPGQYLASLADGLSEADARALAARHGAAVIRYHAAPLNAVALRLSPGQAVALAEDAAVRLAEEDSVVRIASVSWNLDRIDQRQLPTDGAYLPPLSGAGAHVYVVDTGVLTTHAELTGRADEVASFADGPGGGDCHGHGTHLAGVAAGAAVGVAPGAAVHSVRALDCDGVGSVSSLVAALDWVRQHHASPAVALVGVTAGLSPLLERAVRELVEAGVAVVAPAGNDPHDACARLPAAAPEALAVGATSYLDQVVGGSSQGRCVALFAPGAEIRSAWNDGGYRFATGTSQAAAHVAGAAALFLAARPGADPAAVSNALAGNATLGALGGVADGTPNRLLYVGFVVPGANDVTPPGVAILAPADGAVVSGTAEVVVSTDPAGVSQVGLFVDGRFLGADSDGTDGWRVAWPTQAWANGPHALVARAYDAAGNAGEASATVTVANPGNAAYDPGLRAPACADAGQRCASGPLLQGRGPVGPEPNAPNTIQSLCLDGPGGSYRQDESVEAIEVQAAVPGRDLAEGEWVNVDVTVWAYPDYGTDRVDLHFARDAGAPAWEYLATAEVPGAGLQTVRFTYRLPAFPDAPRRTQQAVRATIRYGGAAAECSPGPFDDHDDLAFAVADGAPDLAAPLVAITSPAPGATLSGTLASGGTVTLAASAEDAAGGAVTRVEFYAGDRLLATSFAPVGGLYLGTWRVDAEPEGPYLLHAVAYDASGNAGRSAGVPVTVADLEPPAVRIDRPDAGSFVGGVVRVEAAADDNRAVMRVELRVDGEVIGTAASPPWAVDWDSGSRSGPVTLEAQAWDAHLTATSAAVTVTLDNAPPSVAIVAPAAGAAVSGPVEVRIQAADDDQVARVELYAGGAYLDAATWNGSLWVVGWNSGALPNGVVELQARAFDRAGNAGWSAPVAVEVKDLVAPAVAITEPAAGALLRGTVQVSATATDDGVVTGVDFLANGGRIDFDAEAPYGVPWSTALLPDGEVVLKARASDLAGNAGEATVAVTVDNHGPAVAVASPAPGTVHGVVTVKAVATDPYGVDFVDLWADGTLLGRGAPVAGEPDAYAAEWVTTDFDNRTFALVAEAHDLAGNVSRSAPVAAAVSNATTAEYDPALGAPACATAAAWCFSGTLLEAAGPGELHAPNTLGGTCLDGPDSRHFVTESVEGITVSAESGPLAPGATVSIRVRYWAYAANEADQLDVYHAADATDPAWTWLGTATPAQAGANEAEVKTVLPTGPLQAVRANLRFAEPGPSPCSGGAFGDRDDLAFAVGSPADSVKPTVRLDAPADGATVSGDVTLLATAGDDQGVAKVEFRVDGSLLETVARPPYRAVWPAGLAADGPHTVQVRAFDTSGNEAAAGPARVTVQNVANAAFDPALGVPACAAVASFCDSGTLLDGRGPVGPEANAPNTLGASCLDGAAGAYHVDESLDWIKVSSVDGLPMAAGKRARVEARVWAWTGWSEDALDLFFTSTPDDPHWIRFATLRPDGPGAQVLAAEFTLPAGERQAVRGRYRYGGTAGPCGAGLYDDHDDLVFSVEYTPNAAYDHKLRVPACGSPAAWCDSGALLDGRGTVGPEPNQPNTIGGLCADGGYGAYHVEPSVDRVLVRTDDLTPLRAGRTARLEVRVFASASWGSERVDLFTASDPDAAVPAWSYLGTLRPSRAGSQVLVGSVPLGGAGPLGLRARFFRERWPYLPVACDLGSGANAVDDHDDLVLTVAP